MVSGESLLSVDPERANRRWWCHLSVSLVLGIGAGDGEQASSILSSEEFWFGCSQEQSGRLPLVADGVEKWLVSFGVIPDDLAMSVEHA